MLSIFANIFKKVIGTLNELRGTSKFPFSRRWEIGRTGVGGGERVQIRPRRKISTTTVARRCDILAAHAVAS